MVEERKDLGTPPPEIEREKLVGEALTALSARRREFFEGDNPLAGYLKKKWGADVVEMTDQRRERYKKRAEQLVETLLNDQTPSGKAISELSRRYRRDLRLAAGATGLSFPGVEKKEEKPVTEQVETMAIAEGTTEEAIPEIAPEETIIESGMMPPVGKKVEEKLVTEEKETPREKLSAVWRGLREAFSARVSSKVGEKVAAILGKATEVKEKATAPLTKEEQEAALERQKVKVSWDGLSGKVKGFLGGLVKETGAPKLVEAVKSIGAPLSKEEIEAVEVARDERARAREKAVQEALEAGKAKVLASPEAVRDWVAGQWEKVSAPLTKEDLEAALEAQRFKMPDLKKLSPKELSERLKAMDPATRRKVAITLGITAAVGVTALGYYEIVGRHGKDFQMVAQYLSGLGQAGRELVAKATEAISTATNVPAPTEIPTAVSVPPVSPGVPAAPGGAERTITTTPIRIDEQIKLALAAKKAAVQAGIVQVKQLAQTGVEIVKGGNVWQASGNAAGQILEASGVQSDPERLIILTDTIKDIAKEGGLGDVVQPGTMLKVNPEAVANHLNATIENIKNVQAVGGTLEVPADQADLTALAKVAKFLGGF